MNDSNWQDITDHMWGGAIPETETIDPVQTWTYTEKPKRRESLNSSGHLEAYEMRQILPWIAAACVLFLVVAIFISLQPKQIIPCSEMLDFMIKDLPARCLAELSGASPR